MSYKGKFQPSYPKKYKGNPANIIYRSLWERKFMMYCDKNENILEWASEEIALPYRSPVDNRVHRYFPDFYIKYKDTSGKIKLISEKFTSTQKINLNGKQQKNIVLIVVGNLKFLLKGN